MDILKQLKEQAQELIDFGNSGEKQKGRGMMEVIEQVENNYTPSWKSISWDVADFEGRALEKKGNEWEKYYDKSKFEDALERMISKHDAELGITWITIDFYLDEYCKLFQLNINNKTIDDINNFLLLIGNKSNYTFETGEYGMLFFNHLVTDKLKISNSCINIRETDINEITQQYIIYTWYNGNTIKLIHNPLYDLKENINEDTGFPERSTIIKYIYE